MEIKSESQCMGNVENDTKLEMTLDTISHMPGSSKFPDANPDETKDKVSTNKASALRKKKLIINGDFDYLAFAARAMNKLQKEFLELEKEIPSLGVENKMLTEALEDGPHDVHNNSSDSWETCSSYEYDDLCGSRCDHEESSVSEYSLPSVTSKSSVEDFSSDDSCVSYDNSVSLSDYYKNSSDGEDNTNDDQNRVTAECSSNPDDSDFQGNFPRSKSYEIFSEGPVIQIDEMQGETENLNSLLPDLLFSEKSISEEKVKPLNELSFNDLREKHFNSERHLSSRKEKGNATSSEMFLDVLEKEVEKERVKNLTGSSTIFSQEEIDLQLQMAIERSLKYKETFTSTEDYNQNTSITDPMSDKESCGSKFFDRTRRRS